MAKEVIKPYSKEGSKKKQVGKMFDNIAPYYDKLNRILSLGIDIIWRRKAIRQLKPYQNGHVLDVATGTGDFAIEILKQQPTCKITGIDISNEMLEVGNKKLKKRNLTDKITLQWADSEKLPFLDNTFDAATVAFGVRNFENLKLGISEIQRVLKPNGRLVVLELSRPQMFPFKQLYNMYFKNVLPFIGKFFSKDPRAYAYLYESVQNFPDRERFLELLEEEGFNSNKCLSLTLGICSIYIGDKQA